ncbi:RICIN domain-containing protein [Streptomyces sp. NPDC057217]|uniref:RICIN domain-containing protein n=1 Tax=Streptomyces sp. NPDC057217 TaxID=3346054 RepID=UPI003625FB68
MTIRLRLPVRVVALAAALFAAVAAVPLTATAAQAVTPICISGAIQYDYRSAEDGPAKPTRTKPLRSATVELWGAEKSTDAPHALDVVGHTATDNGSYSLCYVPTTTTSLSTVWVKVRAQSPGNIWRVIDDGDQSNYTFDLPALSNATGEMNVGTAKPPANAASPWHIFDTINTLYWKRSNPGSWCWTSHEMDSNQCTPLTIAWRSYNPGGGSWYTPSTNTISTGGPDADSEHLILHEVGHFLMHRMFNGAWPSSLTCGSHWVSYVSTEGCAWSEGFALAAAAYALGDSRYVSPDGGSTSFTYGDGWGVGDQVEGNVAGSLLDLWRTADTNWNRSIAAITAHKPLTFSAYFNTTRPAANPPLSTDSTALAKLNPHTIDYGPSIVGNGTYYTLSNGSALAMEVSGSCTAASGADVVLGTRDATRAWQRWKLEPNTDGTVRLTNGCAQPLTLTANPAAGGTVTAKTYDPANRYQKWKVTRSNGTLKLTSLPTGFALDRKSAAPGSTVTVYSSGSSNSQSWAALS